MTHNPDPPTPPDHQTATGPHVLTYDVAELAQALGCSERHVWRLLATGELPPAVRIGRLVRWSRAAIDRWLADGCPRQRPAARR